MSINDVARAKSVNKN